MVRPCSCPARKLEAGYIDARPHIRARSTKPSCNGRPDHTFGSWTAQKLHPRLSPILHSQQTLAGNWCADSIVAQRHFALSRFDFRSFRASVGKITPGRGGYQRTNLPYMNEGIPESHESLAVSNVRGICFRGNPG